MERLRILWRKLGAQFSDTNRKGWEELVKVGYVEEEDFKKFVLQHIAIGDLKCYCCAICEYVKKQEGAKFGIVCTKLNNAEDAPWGCCDKFEYDRNKINELQ